MGLMAFALLTAALSLAGWTWRLSLALRDRQRELVALEHALMDYVVEEQCARLRQAALLEQQQIVEKSVDTGASSAEVVHKAVAGVTFGILDAIPATKGVSRLVRGLHNGIADTIYDTVRTSNKEIGGLAKELLKLKGDLDTARRRGGGKPGAAREKAKPPEPSSRSDSGSADPDRE